MQRHTCVALPHRTQDGCGIGCHPAVLQSVARLGSGRLFKFTLPPPQVQGAFRLAAMAMNKLFLYNDSEYWHRRQSFSICSSCSARSSAQARRGGGPHIGLQNLAFRPCHRFMAPASISNPVACASGRLRGPHRCKVQHMPKKLFAALQKCLSRHNLDGAAAAAAHHKDRLRAQEQAVHAKAGPAQAALLAVAPQRIRQQLPAYQAHVSTLCTVRSRSLPMHHPLWRLKHVCRERQLHTLDNAHPRKSLCKKIVLSVRSISHLGQLCCYMVL